MTPPLLFLPGGNAPSPGNLEERTPFLMRSGLAAGCAVYALARFGLAAGLQVLAAALLFVFLDWLQQQEVVRRRALIGAAMITLQVAIVTAVFFAPAPFGFGSAVPGPMMMETPYLMLLFCLLASHVSASRPVLTLWTGLSILAAWLVIRGIILADPRTLTRADINVAHYKTFLAVLRAINRPDYFNVGLWSNLAVVIGSVTLILSFAAYRVHRLALRTARLAALRDALSAYFSPQVVNLLSKARDVGLTRWSKDLAVIDCDLAGFTPLAETLAPEQVAALLSAYRATVEAAVFESGGAILSFTGDGIAAVFGLTEEDRAPAREALQCAGRILREWPQAASAIVAHPPGLAIGIEYGPARAGLVGEGRAVSLLLLGAPVEAAAALQALTRDAQTPLLIGGGERAALIAAEEAVATRLHPVEIGEHKAWRPEHV